MAEDKFKNEKMLLKLMMTSQLVNELMDELRPTVFYKSSLKVAANNFAVQIAQHCNPHITRVFNTDSETASKILAGMERILKADVYNIGKLEEIMTSLETCKDDEVITINIEK